MTPTIVKDNNHIIVFDDECNLCNSSVKFILKYDKNKIFKFTSVKSNSGRQLLQWCKLSTEQYKTLVFINNGNILYKSQAILSIAQSLPFPWPILTVLKLIPIFIRDYCYNLVATNRYSVFGKTTTCLIPTKEIRERFI